jgi:uncharacterized membrane protein YoaK (UPF0700 family)
LSTIQSNPTHPVADASHGAATPWRSERWLPILLSVIAGMVDLIGFLSLGIFTAHITGNIVVIGALVVRYSRVNPAQILAIPVFILAVAGTWLLARASGRRGPGLLRLLLLVQFLLLTCVLIFSVITKPSTNPHGLIADIAAMMAVSAMACQFALLRLGLPVAPSTAVMTGNLAKAVLSFLDTTSRTPRLTAGHTALSNASLHLLIGFFGGCVLAAAAVTYLADWAWSLPAALAGVPVAVRINAENSD